MTIRVNDIKIEDLESILSELRADYKRVDLVVDDEAKTVHIYPVEELKVTVFKITDDNIRDLI